MPKTNHKCVICDKEFVSYRTIQYTCSKICKTLYQSGENNPNYGGKSWTEEKRKEQSLIIKSKVDDEYRKKAGSANRGKKFSKERIESMHGHRTKESYSRPMPKEVKKKVGIASSAKFTDEYKEKQRKKMINNGHWIPDELKSDYQIYFKYADWIKPMWELADKEMLKEHGVYNSYNNRKGLVRDHCFSRLEGFELGIFPEILRHPTNCQIITHGNNSSKRRKCSKTLEELFRDIEEYACAWDEQVLVLDLITRWKRGERFSAQTYRRKSAHAQDLVHV